MDLAEDNRLLFNAVSVGSGAETQNALFFAQLPDRSVSILTAFPEKMELIEDGKTILIHNAFGSQWIPVSGGLPQIFPASSKSAFSSFSGVHSSRVENTAVSPDGRWLLYVEPSSHAKGTLVLMDGISGRKIPVSFDTERPGRFFPALWSADSRTFLYAKGGRLYFYTISEQIAPLAEQRRIIGEGAITSLYRGSGGFFYYFRGSLVYRIRSSELFTRSLYTSFLESGEIAGRIPFEFDPNFDRFWIAPDGLSLILCKGGRNLFYYPLGIQEDTKTDFASLPYVIAPRGGARLDVLWSAEGIATILIGESADNGTLAYRLNTRAVGGRTSRNFEMLEPPPAFQALLSPDGRRVLFWGKNGLYLYDYRNWSLLTRLESTPVYSCLWLENNEIIAGNGERIENIRLSENTAAERKLLCLAAVSGYGFEKSSNIVSETEGTAFRRILAYSGDSWYSTDGESPWTACGDSSVQEAALSSGQYRVYMESASGFFENVPMIRNVLSVGTFPLFDPEILRGVEIKEENRIIPAFERNPSRLPAAEQSYVFTHGNRGIREIALCFDLYDDVSGLWTVLDALKRYGVRATFFVNGEFIRRHPQAAKELSTSEHEIASMFFAPLDLSDSRYRIDGNFVTRGLARNEDEFNKATGKELSLFWHPPFYNLSREIADAAAAAGYRTVGRDIDSRDWIRSSDARRLGIEQPSAADIIDFIMDAKENGSIIPIRLGQLEGGRADYLFNHLEVLLDALIREDYNIVTVSTLFNRL